MKKLILFFLIVFSVVFINTEKANSQTGYNAVLEYCTGTWCQWCPCGHTAVHDILTNYPNTVVLAYHGASSDPWQTYSAGIRGIFGFNLYPTGVVGRKTGIISNSAWNNEVVLQSLLVQPGVNINVSSKNYDEVSRTLTATIQITANTDLTGDYYVNYVLTENNIVYPQTGNSSCTGGSNYIHYNIVKSMINGDLGEIVNSGNWTSGQMITKSLNYTVPGSPQIVNPENCDLNIFVYKSGTSISSNSNIQQGLKISLTGTTGISNTNTVASDYSLSQNYPNPFNPVTNFSFTLPKDDIVSLKIYDILGNEVETYIDGFVRKGSYSVEFDGSGLSSGIYFYNLTSGEFSQTKKMILSK